MNLRADIGASALARKTPQRPPWTTEARIREHCTSCGACVAACPEGLLDRGPAGTPAVNFSNADCTFCTACVQSCPEPVFLPVDTRPWDIVAQIGPDCFLASGIACRSCTDACDAGALVFDLRSGAVGQVRVTAETCTGCGACVASCPAAAITVGAPVIQGARA